MSIRTSERYQAVILQLKGEFYGSVHGPSLREAIAEFREAGKLNVVLDLSRTAFMDSSAIGVLIEAAQDLRSDGGDLRLAEVEKRIRNLFLMTRLLGEVFELYETLDEAVESFNTPVPA